MARSQQQNIARLYHLTSSNSRWVIPELEVDTDRHPHKFRTYAGAPRVALPAADYDLPMSLGESLANRRSVRDFALKPLSLDTVGRLLYASYGVRGYRSVEGQWFGERSVPSGGGLYPLEIYLATQQVEGLEDGIYHYDARCHELELRRAGLFHDTLADLTIDQDMIRTANLVLMISAVFERTMWKYGQRGYRFVLMEAGHLGQNIYLVSTALGLGPVAIGGFFDGEVNELALLPDGEEMIYLVCVGQAAT